MNILIYSLIIFVVVYFLLKFIASASTKRLTRTVRVLIFIISVIFAILFAFGGRFLLSLPLILLSFAIVKLKGLSLFQLFALFLAYMSNKSIYIFHSKQVLTVR